MTGISSQSLDVNNLLFPCIDTELRLKEGDIFLKIHHEACESIYRKKNHTMYSLEEFKSDYNAKIFYGFIIAVCMIPISMMRSGDAPDMMKLFTVSEREAEMQIYREKITESIFVHEHRHERFSSMFLKLQEDGFFN